MHAVMRDYSGDGAKKLFDILEKRTAEVKEVIRPIKGFGELFACPHRSRWVLHHDLPGQSGD